MLDAGIQIDRALDILSKQAAEPEVREAMSGLARAVQSGKNLADAMQRYPDCFTRLDVSLIKVALTSGSLPAVFKKLADHHESTTKVVGKAIAALAYPAITLLLCLAIIAIGPPFLFRGMFEMLKSSNIALPWITKVVISISDLMLNPLAWVATTVAVAAILPAARQLNSSPVARSHLDRLSQRVYIVGPLFKLLAVARFARTLASLTHIGLPILQSLAMAAECSSSSELEDAVAISRSEIKMGQPIGDALHNTGYFPPLLTLTLKVGEETGQLSKCLNKIADIYETELDYGLETCTAALGPVVTAILGAVVALLNLAILIPMVKFTQSLN